MYVLLGLFGYASKGSEIYFPNENEKDNAEKNLYTSERNDLLQSTY